MWGEWEMPLLQKEVVVLVLARFFVGFVLLLCVLTCVLYEQETQGEEVYQSACYKQQDC